MRQTRRPRVAEPSPSTAPTPELRVRPACAVVSSRFAIRLACGVLLTLALGLAGAASTAVQAMSRPADYEPWLVQRLEPLESASPILLASEIEYRADIEPQVASPPPPPPRPRDLPPPPPSAVSRKVAPRIASPSQSATVPLTPRKPSASNEPKAKIAEVVPEAPLPPAPKPDAARVAVRDRLGRRQVGRIYGKIDDRTAVMLPDGQIGFIEGVVQTDDPFVPSTMKEIRSELLKGDYPDFKVMETKHYLVFYRGSEAFAKDSANLLEKLYESLGTALRRRGFEIHETEFPLVAVIYPTEVEFRARKKVGAEVQAYYEILSNRIFLYERSNRDGQSPETALLSKPQTVAHEGAHQVLQNIGVQPRLADWPLWLVEGFAEYCSPPKLTKTGVAWAGLNQINPLHMVTIRDLDDPLSTYVQGANTQSIRRDSRSSWIETLVKKSELTPTDYALSWALVHYLANKHLPEFLEYLREMSLRPPLERRDPQDHLADFQKAFGKNLNKLDTTVAGYLGRLKKFDVLPYYAVSYEQPLNNGSVYRATMVSQSPSMIQQWIESIHNPRGGQPHWQILPHSTRARAILSSQEWMGSRN